MTSRGRLTKFVSGPGWIREGGSRLSSASLGLARPGSAWLGQRGLPPFSDAKVYQKLTKNRARTPKIVKNHPRAPKSVTKAAGPNPPQLLGPSWAALGTLPGRPGRASGRPKRSPERQNACQRRFLTHFFASYFHGAFRIDFFTQKFATICTETSKISVSPRREHDFHEIDFFV